MPMWVAASRAMVESDRYGVRVEHGGELPLADLEVVEGAREAGRVAAGRGEAALGPGVDVEQGHAHAAVGVHGQRFGRGVEPLFAVGGEQRGLEQRPQRGQAHVFVLQGHHRGQVVERQQARMLDRDREAVLGQQRGVGAGHAGVEQHLLQAFAHRRDVGGVAAQQQRQQLERAAGELGRGRQAGRQAFLAGTEADDPAAGGPGRAGGKPPQFGVHGVAGAQQLGRVEQAGHHRQVQRRRIGHQPGQVAGDQAGQFPGVVHRKREAARFGAWRKFQCKGRQDAQFGL